METSFLKRGLNNLLIYIQSEMKRPSRAEFQTNLLYDRANAEYVGRQKFFIIKPEDEKEVLKIYQPIHLQALESEAGLDIPYQNLQTYTDEFDGKKYAKASGISVKTNTASEGSTIKKEEKAETQTPAVIQPKEQTNKLFFEIQVDEANGEPLLQFFYDGKVETMEDKILKSFVIKAIKFGIDIESVKNNFYQIKISNK